MNLERGGSNCFQVYNFNYLDESFSVDMQHNTKEEKEGASHTIDSTTIQSVDSRVSFTKKKKKEPCSSWMQRLKAERTGAAQLIVCRCTTVSSATVATPAAFPNHLIPFRSDCYPIRRMPIHYKELNGRAPFASVVSKSVCPNSLSYIWGREREEEERKKKNEKSERKRYRWRRTT